MNNEISSNDSQKSSEFLIIVVAVIFVLAVAAFWFFYIQKGVLPWKKTTSEPQSQELPVITPDIVRVPEGQQAEGLPADISLYAKTKITESYSATYPNSTAKQTTVVFKSSKTPKQIYDFYTKWAKDNKWDIISQSDDEALKSLYLKKGVEDINITITNESITISYVKF